jgi:tetratricopeptide (TPR) repeat protein
MSFVVVALLCLSSCAEQTQVKRLNEREITAQELMADQARQQFYSGQYDEMPALLEPLCLERTTSQPLYRCELGVSYLARNNKSLAKQYLLDAYTSIEEFFDPTSEKKAMSLWGAEAEKVYKGEPYEQATLSMLVGLLLLEEGDVDNALSCFKNGQIADSDVENEMYQSDYAALQLLEAKCYQMRREQAEYDQFIRKAVDSFSKTHPFLHSKRAEIVADNQVFEASKEELIRDSHSYYDPLMRPFNTLLLVWTGRSPEMHRTGQYGEGRVLVKCPSVETHYEVQLDGSSWHDVIRGFANVSFQATTRGGREMDNVLADQAAFKRTSHEVGKAFIDAADDVSDPYAALVLMGVGLISHGIGAATKVQSDIRSWETLPDQIALVPLQLTAGMHQVRIDCYDKNFRLNRSVTHQFTVDERPFQFYTLVVPSMIPPE